MRLPTDPKRAWAAVIRCHLFHCAYHPVTTEEADAVSGISLTDNKMSLEKIHTPELSGVQREKATHKALRTHTRKARGRFQCAPGVEMDIFMGRRKKNKMKELK